MPFTARPTLRVVVLLGVAIHSAHAQQPDRAALAAKVDTIARAALAAERIPGLSIAVLRGADTVVLRGWGYADLENRVPATPQTVYRIGSLTKQFTALAILQLAEQGRLSLDDTLQRFVPSFPTPGRRITIRQLLTHTSGVPSYTSIGRAWQEKMRLDLPHDSLLALVRDRVPDFAPGERFLYDNTGYYLLGMVIEAAAGQPYPQYLAQHLFAPLGLGATTYCDTRRVIADRAQGYQVDSTGVVNADFISMTQPFAAGSLCSSVRDLLTWQRALAADRLLRPGGYAAMSTPGRLSNGTATGYGFGLGTNALDGHRHIGHSGGINGFSAMLSAYPDDSLIVVVLANSEDANPGRIAQRIARAAFGIAEAVVRDLAVSAAERARFAGTYRLSDALDIRVFAQGESVMAQATGQGAWRLLSQGGGVFLASFDTAVRVVFEMAGDRAAALTLYQGAPRRAPRVTP
jgi:CubicO group peptidase (beta-lactamase class C family)